MRTLVAGLAVSALAATCGFAQSVISAHSGVIHYTEGKVLLNDKVYEAKTSEFGDLKDHSVLKTEEGRAELLLTPGVFLRVGENSSIRMVSNRLSDTRVEVLSGEALVECDELLKDNQVTILYKDATVAITKHGLYRFDVPPARLRVYDGEAIVHNPSGQLTAKKGQEVMLNDGALMASKFDAKTGDELMRWAARRSGYISMANVASARSAGTYGSSFGGWTFNPWFGMYTFIPMNGILYSPFGYPFWSPYAAYMWAPYYSGYYYGGYYGYTPTTTANSFHPVGRWNSSNPYSGSRTARAPGFASGGAISRGDRGGSTGGGFNGGGFGAIRGGGGGYSGGGGMAASGGGGGGMAAGGGGGAHGGGGGGGSHR